MIPLILVQLEKGRQATGIFTNPPSYTLMNSGYVHLAAIIVLFLVMLWVTGIRVDEDEKAPRGILRETFRVVGVFALSVVTVNILVNQ